MFDAFRLMPVTPIKTSDFLTELTHVGYWLNNYRPAKNRSKRLLKKMLQGTRKRKPVVTKMMEERPARKVYFMHGVAIAHPSTLSAITADMTCLVD
jgi:hypothetical protein